MPGRERRRTVIWHHCRDVRFHRTTDARSRAPVRSLQLVSPRCLEWSNAELPDLQTNEVLVRTGTGAVSVGSELPLYLGTARRVAPVRYPVVTGYENVGTIVARGSKVTVFEEGDRVVASYGHRSHGVVSEDAVIPVPEGISDELALLSILTCDVAKGIRKLAPRPEEPVLVMGGGAIGLLALFVLKAYGIRDVDLIEPQEERRKLAAKLGARETLTPDQDMTFDHYPIGFECSASAAAFSLLQEKMRPGGKLCVLSDGNVEPLVLNPAFHEKELLVVGSSDGWDYREHARWYFDVVREATPGLDKLFDLHVAADDLIRTFEELARGGVQPMKVLVRY